MTIHPIKIKLTYKLGGKFKHLNLLKFILIKPGISKIAKIVHNTPFTILFTKQSITLFRMFPVIADFPCKHRVSHDLHVKVDTIVLANNQSLFRLVYYK